MTSPSPRPRAFFSAAPVAKPTSKLTASPSPSPTAAPTLAPTTDYWSTDDDVFSYSYSDDWDDDWVGTKCACSAFYNGADAEDEFLCVKKSNGVCRPPNGGDGLCPGDHDMCSNKHKG